MFGGRLLRNSKSGSEHMNIPKGDLGLGRDECSIPACRRWRAILENPSVPSFSEKFSFSSMQYVPSNDLILNLRVQSAGSFSLKIFSISDFRGDPSVN